MDYLATAASCSPLLGIPFILAFKKQCRTIALCSEALTFLFSLLYSCASNVDKLSFVFSIIISFVCLTLTLFVFNKKNVDSLLCLLCIESLSIGSFFATDMFLLFALMESTIIPVYIMMSSRTSSGDQNYIFKYLIYSMTGAMLVLVSFIEINIETGSSDIFEICRIGVKSNVAFWTMLSGLCFKLPVWPFCGWLPEAHSKSNFTCSVILASIILKFSALIMIRFLTPIFSEYIVIYKGAIFAVLIVSMTFSIARSAFQNDLKRFFAYFSIFHMNLYFMIALDKGRDSSIIFSMAQHSLIIMFLFVLTDIIEKKIGSRLISEIELSNRGLGKLRGFLMLGIVSLIGSPLTPGFISEIVSIYSVSRISIFCALAVTLTILATSFIAFNMYSSTFKQKSETKCVIDLTSRETLVLSLMTVCILALGIFPQLFCRQP